MHSGAEVNRRDFYPLPASDNLLLLAATLCQRSRRVLKECWERAFPTNTADNHQSNLSRFLLGDNEVFDRTKFRFRSLLRSFRYRKKVQKLFQLVQVAPAKGTVVIYRSDIFPAGLDNRSDKPRHMYSLSLARIVVHYGN
jgi:hypothetical protein